MRIKRPKLAIRRADCDKMADRFPIRSRDTLATVGEATTKGLAVRGIIRENLAVEYRTRFIR